MSDLSVRQKEYEDHSELSLMRRVPVVIRVDGRNFKKVTEKLPKPSSDLIHVMANTMLYVIKEIQGAVFGFTHSDEILFILRNDQSLESEPWFQNRISKITSITASLATKGFEKSLMTLDSTLDLIGDPVFDCRASARPNIPEAANCVLWRQFDCISNSVTMAAINHLSQKLGHKTALKLLHEKNTKERKQLLLEKCDIDFDEYFSAAFRHGVAVYRTPTIINDTYSRDKWTLDFDLPLFSEEQDFIYNILINGTGSVKTLRE